jgi:ribosomal protein L15E
MDTWKERRGKLIRRLTAAAAIAWAAGSAWASGAVVVTAAQWRPESSVLRIEGTSTKPDAVILVRDAHTRALLGSAAVRADGKWMLKIRDPAAVPARARVELGSQCVECDVTGPAVAQ